MAFPVSGAPEILYTDIVAGPNTGGEDDDGVYLSIFGLNFGNEASQVSVTVGGGAVAKVIYLGASNGRPDVEQLSVQLGATAQTGEVVVSVGNKMSSNGPTFTVSSGNLYYVDNVNGGDGNAGTFAAPLKTLATAEGKVAAGDFMILKANAATPYPPNGTSVWPVKVGGTSGSAAITMMGYPARRQQRASAGTRYLP